MLDKSLKIFGLDNNFSLDELEEKYKKLLKEFDTKNIEDDLKVVFLEEQVRIREAYQTLLKHCHEREKVSSIGSKGKTLPVKAEKRKKQKKMLPIIMTLCALLAIVLGFVFKDNIENLFSGSDTNKEKEETYEEEEEEEITYEIIEGADTFNYTGAMQTYVVPDGVTSITIEAYGAEGGGGDEVHVGGLGSIILGDFPVSEGQILNVLVGGEGETKEYTGGGGGGSFVWDNSSSLFIAAGGGGGASNQSDGKDASHTIYATNGTNAIDGAGDPGNGGTTPSYSEYASGGTGWYSNGVDGTIHECEYNTSGGITPLSGGSGGSRGGEYDYVGNGGFGGGGGGNGKCGAVGGGGGGGYTGGGPGVNNNSFNGGGGGGSYNSGTNQNNTSGVHSGNGLVIISYCINCDSKKESEKEEEEAEEEEEKEEEVAPEEEVEAEEEEGGDWAEDAPEENEGGAEGGDWEPPRGNMERYMDLIEEGKSHEEAVEIMENKKKEPIIEVRECDCDKKVNLNKYPDCKQLAEKEIKNQDLIVMKKEKIIESKSLVETQERICNETGKRGAELDAEEDKLKKLKLNLKNLKEDLKNLEKKSECDKIQEWKSALKDCTCNKGKKKYDDLYKVNCN